VQRHRLELASVCAAAWDFVRHTPEKTPDTVTDFAEHHKTKTDEIIPYLLVFMRP
jgi:hypothetical protein